MPIRADLPSYCSQLREELPRLAAEYGVVSLAVFGSYVRGEQQANSDLDILVTFTKLPGLIRFVRLENELSDLLGVKVDLVLRDSLKPDIASEHPLIPWREIAGMRDKLIHDYVNVNNEIVWETVKVDIPLLIPQIEGVRTSLNVQRGEE